MAQPTAYDRIASFSNIQAQAPSDPLPGNTLDAELNAIKVTLDAILTNIAQIQRDDGALANQSVGLDQLSEEIEVGWSAPEVWVTATAYVVGNTVFRGSGFYRCLTAHTAGTFSTDLAAAKWELIVDLSDLTIVAASQIANTPSGSIAATTVQAAIDELASEKAASSHTHPASAISDSTSAGRALLTAATVAAQQALLGLDTLQITELPEQVTLSGIIEPAALGSDTNDWAPIGLATASIIRMSASAAINLTGLTAPADDGTVVVLQNVGTAFAITLPPSSSASAAANRFLIPKPVVVGPNQSVALQYDKNASVPRWRLFDRVASLPRGHIFGLTLSNGTDTTNDINIATGECRGEHGLLDLVVTTAIGKQLDQDLAEGGTTGTPTGGRYSGAAITNTTYHVHLIGKADGTVNVMFYTGLDPTSVLPTGYIDYRRIGSIIRASSAILQFTQAGDYFRLKTPPLDINTTSLGTSSTSYALTVPSGLSVEAHLNAYASHAASTTPVYLRHPSDTDTAPANSAAPLGTVVGANTLSQVRVFTNTSREIAAVSAGTSTTLRGATLGWDDTRGRHA